MEADAPTFDEYRTGYIKGRWSVSKNAARAFQLFELGYSVAGAAKYLPVTKGTVKKYNKELVEKLPEGTVGAVTSTKPRADVFGDRSVEEYGEYSYKDGLADGKEARNQPVTTSKEQMGPDFRPREKPLNRGVALEDIPPQLVNIRTGD